MFAFSSLFITLGHLVYAPPWAKRQISSTILSDVVTLDTITISVQPYITLQLEKIAYFDV